jgi:glycosyltransferase involved in cell wall biosynthesis
MKTLAKARLLVTRFPFSSRLGGEEMHTIALMEGLGKRGYEAFFMGSDEVLIELFERAGFVAEKKWLARPPVTFWWLLAFTAISPVLFLKAGWMLWRARKKWNVNVLYALSLGDKLLMTPWARIFGMKILWLEHARFGNWISKNPWRFVYRALSRWAVTIVTSNAMKPLAEQFAKHVEAISCGVIVDKKNHLSDELAEFCKSGFCVGTVARLTVDKGVDMIVRLVHSKPDVRVVVVGDGPMKTAIEKYTKNGQVMLIPELPRPQLVALYSAMDLFILGSREMDPFGMVAAEAMWQGTPVVVTDVCGISQDLNDGIEAWIVEPRFAAIDKVVKKLQKHPELLKGTANRGRKFVKENYSLVKMIDRFEELF